MPKILRQNLPRPFYAHLLERIQQRPISGHGCLRGEGELVKTFLSAEQVPIGDEV